MSANTAYTLSITGKTFVFKTPANTWRGIQNNLTSDSTTDCLSAAQGKALKAALDGHTHTLNIAADSGTNALSFAFGTKYKLTSGGKDFIFTMPSLGTTATTAAKGNHTHTCTIATDSGENALTLAASTKYKLTAGGSTFIFTTAPDTKYTAANAAPGAIASAGAAGTSTNYARQDHTHAISVATGDSNGQVKVAGQNASVKGLGGSAYLGTTDKPTYNSNTLVKSKGVHARIAYKKVTLSASSWSASTYKDLKTNETFKRQAITTGGDITADTEIVSVQLVGTMEDEYTTTSYTNTFTGDGTTKTFTLDYAPTAITSVTRGGAAVAASGYSVSGRTFTITEAPNSGASLVVNYNVVYSNCTQFSKLKEVVTGASLLEFRAFSTPLVALTVVVGYVSETLDTLSTQATLPTLDSNRYSTV